MTLVERQASNRKVARDRKVAGSMPTVGITSLCPWERPLSVNIPTGSLCDVKDNTCVCFTTAYTGKKKKQLDIVLPVSPKVGLGNNYPMLNVHDIV